MKRAIFDDEHDAFRQLCRDFLFREATPYTAEWESAGIVDRMIWKQAGATGLLGFEVPEEFGGAGIREFRYNAILSEEIAATGSVGVGFTLHNDITAPYLLSLVSRIWRDARVTRIYGGTNEIMKEIVGRSLGF